MSTAWWYNHFPNNESSYRDFPKVFHHQLPLWPARQYRFRFELKRINIVNYTATFSRHILLTGFRRFRFCRKELSNIHSVNFSQIHFWKKLRRKITVKHSFGTIRTKLLENTTPGDARLWMKANTKVSFKQKPTVENRRSQTHKKINRFTHLNGTHENRSSRLLPREQANLDESKQDALFSWISPFSLGWLSLVHSEVLSREMRTQHAHMCWLFSLRLTMGTSEFAQPGFYLPTRVWMARKKCILRENERERTRTHS